MRVEAPDGRRDGALPWSRFASRLARLQRDRHQRLPDRVAQIRSAAKMPRKAHVVAGASPAHTCSRGEREAPVGEVAMRQPALLFQKTLAELPCHKHRALLTSADDCERFLTFGERTIDFLRIVVRRNTAGTGRGPGRDPVLGRRCLSCRISLQDCEPRRPAPAVHVQPASRVPPRPSSLRPGTSLRRASRRCTAHPAQGSRAHRAQRGSPRRDRRSRLASPATRRTPPLRPRPPAVRTSPPRGQGPGPRHVRASARLPAGRERRERGKRASSRAGSGRHGPESHRRTSPPPTVGALHREHREVLDRPPAPRSRRAPPGLHPERVGVEACAGAACSPSRRLRYASPARSAPDGCAGKTAGAGAESVPLPRFRDD